MDKQDVIFLFAGENSYGSFEIVTPSIMSVAELSKYKRISPLTIKKRSWDWHDWWFTQVVKETWKVHSMHADIRYLCMLDSRIYANIPMDLSILNYISYDSDGKKKAWKAVIEGIKPKTLDLGKQIGVDHMKTNVDEKSSIEILWRDILIYDNCKKIVGRVYVIWSSEAEQWKTITFIPDTLDLWWMGLGLI